MDNLVAENIMTESNEDVVTCSPVGQVLHRITEVWMMVMFYSDAQFLRNYSLLAHSCFARAKDILQKRIMWILWHFLAEKKAREELLGLMRIHRTGIGGWQALRIIAPSCENTGQQQRDIMTLYTPKGCFLPFVEFFSRNGYKPQDAIRDAEMQREYYGDTISVFQRMVSSDRHGSKAAIVDIVASINATAALPIFRLPTTLLWNLVSSDAIFIANPSTTVRFQGVINPVLAFASNHIGLPTYINMSIDWLNIQFSMKIRRNPASFCHHECGPNSIDICTYSSRSTSCPDTFFFEFAQDNRATGLIRNRFFEGDGIIWRIGGWSCYEGGKFRTSVLVVVPNRHKDPVAFEGRVSCQALLASTPELMGPSGDTTDMEERIASTLCWNPEPADRVRFVMGDSE